MSFLLGRRHLGWWVAADEYSGAQLGGGVIRAVGGVASQKREIEWLWGQEEAVSKCEVRGERSRKSMRRQWLVTSEVAGDDADEGMKRGTDVCFTGPRL